jgi:hypothetical protein
MECVELTHKFLKLKFSDFVARALMKCLLSSHFVILCNFEFCLEKILLKLGFEVGRNQMAYGVFPCLFKALHVQGNGIHKDTIGGQIRLPPFP